MGAAAVVEAAANEYEFCDGDDSGDDNGENAADPAGVDPEDVAVAAATV
ncbi:hypothetical protein SAMN05216490_1426 [Mucilaginibacter mallensis]|uniref:Uncharacterized protein n=1 Tax=Mucilaginibacter mallensis TaxID=652787 RepID=A0A1H1TEU2_MUCMA|nr:hypothetical protein SAMN05216490_1426 [Mucilaginibacter mallensis]